MSTTDLNPFADIPSTGAGKFPAARGLDGASQCVVVAHISRITRCDSAALPYCSGRVVELLLRSPDQRDLRAILRIARGDGEVYSAAAARYHRGLSGEQLFTEYRTHGANVPLHWVTGYLGWSAIGNCD
jgi:hypothetical protein